MTSATRDEWLASEWLEADGLGGFASGTVGGIRSRRYHALLLAATTPPTGRMVLVNGLEVWLETPNGNYPLSSQCYAPGVIHPDGHSRIVDFRSEPWPTWIFRAEDGTEVGQEVIACHGRGDVVVRWCRRSLPLVGRVGASPARVGKGAPTPCGPATGPDPVRTDQPVRLMVRPLLSGRDYHALHHENPGFGFDAEVTGRRVLWRPYRGVPAISAIADGSYRHEPLWYRNFLYREEQARGLDGIEDLASPGVFTWTLDGGDATLVLSAGEAAPDLDAASLVDAETGRRQAFTAPLHRAADAYVVRRGTGRTIIAGYPWFTDWGRDTFIALRGFMTLPGGLDLARDILLAWAETVSEGMLPNRFPDGGEVPEFNAVDASLWYVVAVHDFLGAAERAAVGVETALARALGETVDAILCGYRDGTRYGIGMDHDGLIAAGVAGVQLTWMDAKVGDLVVTPRIGKPVEVQALWLNALQIAAAAAPEWREVHRRALAAFRLRFWNEARGCLHDVVDVDHEPGRIDPSLRPNQILAVGGLPFPVLAEPHAARVVETVERELVTPLGLRSLARGERGYRERYAGGVFERDTAYHQGTVWPWLMGPFVEAWLRVHGSTPETEREADARFLAPLREHLKVAGLGHVSEVADAEPPHHPGGCPFQAWSLAELIRAGSLVAADQPKAEAEPTSPRPRRVAAGTS